MSTNIVTVRELIQLAFGNKDINTVNFKHVETVLYLMARQLSILQRQVEVRVDPQLIYELTRKPSNLSVTEVKIHATVPEVLEREMFDQVAPLHPGVLEVPVEESLSSPSSLLTSTNSLPAENSLTSVLPDKKSNRVSYGGVRQKHISPRDSDSDNGKKPFSFEFKKPKRKIQKEKYLAVKRRDSEETSKLDSEDTGKPDSGDELVSSSKSGTGSPEDKYKTVSVVTKEQYMKLLEEIVELNEARRRESKQLPESKALIEELHRTSSITHPMSALILSDRLEQSEKKLQQMVTALETLMKRVPVPKSGTIASDPVSTLQDNPTNKKLHDHNMTVSHASQVRPIAKRSTSASKGVSTYPWKREHHSSTDFWSNTFRVDEPSVQMALTQCCRTYGDNEQQDSITQPKQWEKLDYESHSSLSDKIQEEQESESDLKDGKPYKTETRFEREDTSIGQSETESVEYGTESCVSISDGTIVCDPEKCTHCQELDYPEKSHEPSDIPSYCLADIHQATNASHDVTPTNIAPELKCMVKQKESHEIDHIKLHSEESESPTVFDKLEKQEKDTEKSTKFRFMPHVFSRLGNLVPCVNDQNGKPITPSDIDQYEEIYDNFGCLIPRVYSKNGTAIPWSRINDDINLFDKDGRPLQYNCTEFSSKSTSEISFYDENGKKILCADADDYEILYNKIGKIVPRIFDLDGKPVAWSRVNDFAKTRNKYGNMMSCLYDQNGVLIPWWNLCKYDQVYDRSGDVIPRLSNIDKMPKERSKISIDEIPEYYVNGQSQLETNEEKKKYITNNPSTTIKIAVDDKDRKQIENSKFANDINEGDVTNAPSQLKHNEKNMDSFVNVDGIANSQHVTNQSYNYDQSTPQSEQSEESITEYGQMLNKSDEAIDNTNEKKISWSKMADIEKVYNILGSDFDKESKPSSLSITSEVNDAFNYRQESKITQFSGKPPDKKFTLDSQTINTTHESIFNDNDKQGSILAPVDKKIIYDEKFYSPQIKNDKSMTKVTVEYRHSNITPNNNSQDCKQVSITISGKTINENNNLLQVTSVDNVQIKNQKANNEDSEDETKNVILISPNPVHGSQKHDSEIALDRPGISESVKKYLHGNSLQLDTVKNKNYLQISTATQKYMKQTQKVDSQISQIDIEINLYDQNGKRLTKSQIEIAHDVYDKYGNLIPRVYDKDRKPISWLFLDKITEIYDKNGKEVPRVYTKDGELIPLSKETEHNKVYNKTGDLIQHVYDKEGKLITFARIKKIQLSDNNKKNVLPFEKEFLYDKEGYPIPWSMVDGYDQVYNKDGKPIPRVYDSDVNPILWSQMDDKLLVYDKAGKLIQRRYDKSGQPIPWSLMNIPIQEETNITGKHNSKRNKDHISNIVESKRGSSLIQPTNIQADPPSNGNKVTVKKDNEVYEKRCAIVYGFGHLNENLVHLIGPKTISEQTTTTTTSTDPRHNTNLLTKQDGYVLNSVPEIQAMRSQATKTHAPIKVSKNKTNASTARFLKRLKKTKNNEITATLDSKIDYEETDLPDFADFGLEKKEDLVPYLGKNGESVIFEPKAQRETNYSIKDQKDTKKDVLQVNDPNGTPIMQTHMNEHYEAHDEYGNPLPCVYNEHDQPISGTKVDNIDNDLYYRRPIASVYDTDGNPIYRSKMDIHKKIYDKYGNPIPRVFDENGQPITWSTMDYTDDVYDENGELIPQAYNQHGEHIPLSQVGSHPVMYDKLGHGFVYDKHGKPISWLKVDKHSQIYDKHGKIIPRVFTKHGQPVPWSEMDHTDEVYDEKGNLVLRTYDQDDKPIPLSQIGNYAVVLDEPVKKYNGALCDKDGKLVNMSELNNLSEVYDKNGRCIPWSEINDAEQLYDKFGKPVPQLFDEQRNPILISHIPSIIRKLRHCDKHGKTISGKPNENYKKVPTIQTENYNESNLSIDSNHNAHDESGKPISPAHISNVSNIYDISGNPISQVFDKDGNRIPFSEIANIDKVYDKNGNMISKLYDKEGNIIPWLNGNSTSQQYDSHGTLIPQSKTDDFSRVHDRNGILNSCFFDKDGKAISWSKLDEAVDVYDENGKPVPRMFNENGNPIPWSHLDLKNNVYDNNRTPISRSYDKDGNTIPWSKLDHTSKVCDKNGNPILRLHDKDQNDRLISRVNDVNRSTVSESPSSLNDNIYDEYGELPQHRLLDLNNSIGKPIPLSQVEEFIDVFDQYGKNRVPGINDKDTPLSIIEESHEWENKNPSESEAKKHSTIMMSQTNFFDKNGKPLRMSELENNPELHDHLGNIIPRRYDSTGKIIPWSKLEEHDKIYDKFGKSLASTKIYQGSDKDYLENKRRSQIDSLSSRRSMPFSSSTFGDLTSRSYSGQKQSLTEGPDLKILDWALRRELDSGMEILKGEFENNVDVSFERPNNDARQSIRRLTKMRDQLQLVLAIENRMPNLDSNVAQFSQRISAIELHLVHEMTRYQEEITQQQITLELALEAMSEAIANVTGDPQGIEELNGKLSQLKNDTDTFSLAQRDLQDSLNNLKLDLRELRSQVHMISSTKADRNQVSNALKCKATIADLNQVVSREEFAGVIAEMTKLIEVAYDKFNNQEYSWQAAIDDYVKCLNKKASIKSMNGFSGDIMHNIEKLRERKDNLLRLVGEPDMTYNRRQIHRHGTCFCCDTVEVLPESPKQKAFEADKSSTSPESSKKKTKGKAIVDRILCYPGLPPNHGLDARSVFCNRYCGPAQNTAISSRSKTSPQVLIPKELIVKPVTQRGPYNEQIPQVDRKPCLPCNRPSPRKQGTSSTKSEVLPSAPQLVTVVSVALKNNNSS